MNYYVSHQLLECSSISYPVLEKLANIGPLNGDFFLLIGAILDVVTVFSF